ncbi:MAG TPA: cytidylate kinase-like family protein [Caldilineae bacterium]|nr:cytidylate kinase-like family protein [Caldilineae bacterium]
MAVVTISRELGSEGTRIAEAVAQALGAICVDKEVLAEMARQAGLPVEVITEAEERLMSRSSLVSQDMQALFSKGQAGRAGAMDEAAFIAQMSEAIRKLAERDNIVFIGRGAQMILRDHPTALHVHLYAPPEVRARRIQERRGLPTQEVAMQIIRRADERRRSWFRRFFKGADWKSPRYYHLMIDTSRVPPSLATAIIVQAAQAVPSE